MAFRFQVRRRTAANWTSGNEILMDGEPGLETDTLKVKVGDGATAWNSLGYTLAGSGSGSVTTLSVVAANGFSGSVANPGTTPAITLTLSASATDKVFGRSSSGAGAMEEIACTAAGRAIIDDADATAQRATLGLGSMATQAASTVAITGGTITGLGTPFGSTDAANKAYVDAMAAGLKWKASVVAASTAAGTLASSFENGDTLDGVTLATGDRILLKNQASGSENGIYIVAASGAPARATDADSEAELVSAVVFVQKGTANADRAFVCTNDTITVGSTSLVWTAMASVVGALVAANNLSDVASASAAFDALSGLTTLGDLIYGGASGTRSRLAGNTTATKKFLRQTGDGANSAAPAWDTLVAGDIPSLDAAKITTGVTITLTGVSASDNLFKAVAPAGSSVVRGWAGYDGSGNLIGSITLQTSTSNVILTATNLNIAGAMIYTTSGVGRTYNYISATIPTGLPSGFVNIFGDSSATNTFGITCGGLAIRATPGGTTLALIDTVGGLTLSGKFSPKRTATAVSASASVNDFIIGVTSTAAARTITLPTAVGCGGQMYIIKDESGAAATNNISVAFTSSQTLDGVGGTQVIINTNYGVKRIYSDNANWMSC